MPRCTALLLVLFPCLLLPSPARAERPQSAQDVARTFGEQGIVLFEQGNWQDALDRFQRAEDLYHAPTLVLFMARCEVKLGRWLQARDRYQQIANETLPKGASAAFAKAKADAASELAELLPRVPTFTLIIDGAYEEVVEVQLDGKVIAAETLRAGVAVNPGRHEAKISSGSAEPTIYIFQAVAGDAKRTVIRLSSAAPAEPVPPKPPEEIDPLIVGVGAGITVAAAVAGGVGVAVSNGAVSDMHAIEDDATCGSRWTRCRDAWDDANDKRVDYANFAMWSFVTAGAAVVATGLYIGVVVLDGQDDQPAATVVPSGPGVGGVSVVGRW